MSFLGFKKKPTSSLHSHESSKQAYGTTRTMGVRNQPAPEVEICTLLQCIALEYIVGNTWKTAVQRLKQRGFHQLSRKKNRITHVQDHQERNL